MFKKKKEQTNKTVVKKQVAVKEDIKKVLIAGGYVPKEEMEKAALAARKTRTSLKTYLIENGILTPDLMGQALAEHYGVNYADLNSNMPAADLVKKIPEEIAKKYQAVLYQENAERVIVASSNPKQAGLLASLQKIFSGKEIAIYYGLEEDIKTNFVHYRRELDTVFAKIIKEGARIAPEILETIYADALSLNASDIHFEPTENEVTVRFRIDGLLQEAGQIPKEYYENIINKIKIQSHMRIDEHFAAQDGAIRYQKDDQKVDFRVSIIPTLLGEKVAMRLLSQYVRNFGMAGLGLSEKYAQMLKAAVKKPFGMIIVSGPTGSGKTTTLYSLLKVVNSPEINLTTIEDPVEYKMEAVNQIQVNPKTNLTFAKGLRSIVRQDPDIILVGEIRDKETAKIAVNAALTGHLLLSTFHANDSATTIPRLLDMEVEPFLMASTLSLILSQRLVRKICEHCRYSYSISKEEATKQNQLSAPYFSEDKLTLYKGKGCPTCNQTGFHGRMAIFEIIEINQELKDLILKNPSTKEIWEVARKYGNTTLFEDGIDKVKAGTTTLEELLRVAEPPAADEIPAGQPSDKVVLEQIKINNQKFNRAKIHDKEFGKETIKEIKPEPSN